MPSFQTERAMMLALMGQPSDVDSFLYVLGEKLHKTVTELRMLPHQEILEWAAYFKACSAIEGVGRG